MKKILVILTLVSFLSNSAFAIFSPRALGMGGAYTALADDPFAAYWNPAGFAVNPGVDLATHYQLNNRNKKVGDNALALKACFEIGMNPFAWIAGIGLASIFALEGAKYLSERDIVKKGWGRSVKAVKKEEPLAEKVKEEEEKRKKEGKDTEREPISRREVAKKAAKEIVKGTIYVGEKFAKLALQEAARQTRNYYYAPSWYRPDYYRPNYWDDRYDYEEQELTPAGKAQFAVGLSIMSDRNDLEKTNTNWYTLSVASGWGEIVALGGNLNIYDIELTNYSPSMRGLGAGFDVGALLRISDKAMFGLAAKELLTTDIKFENKVILHYQMSLNGGIALKPIRQVTVAADVHNIFGQYGEDPTYHYGLEVRPIYGVAVRAGLSDNNKTAGLSMGIGQLILDYTYLGGAYNRTQMVGATWKM